MPEDVVDAGAPGEAPGVPPQDQTGQPSGGTAQPPAPGPTPEDRNRELERLYGVQTAELGRARAALELIGGNDKMRKAYECLTQGRDPMEAFVAPPPPDTSVESHPDHDLYQKRAIAHLNVDSDEMARIDMELDRRRAAREKEAIDRRFEEMRRPQNQPTFKQQVNSAWNTQVASAKEMGVDLLADEWRSRITAVNDELVSEQRAMGRPVDKDEFINSVNGPAILVARAMQDHLHGIIRKGRSKADNLPALAAADTLLPGGAPPSQAPNPAAHQRERGGDTISTALREEAQRIGHRWR